MARSHVALGLAAWVVAAPLLHQPVFDPVSGLLVVAGSLLPDIDHPDSWVGRRTRPLSTFTAAVLGHRGITHSLVAVIGLFAVLLQAEYSRIHIWPLVIGYAAHLLADMLTPRGLRLAWPLRRTWGLPLCRTGSPTEGIIVALLCAAAWWSLTHTQLRQAAWHRSFALTFTLGTELPRPPAPPRPPVPPRCRAPSATPPCQGSNTT